MENKHPLSDKLILVFYINIGCIKSDEIETYMNKILKETKENDEIEKHVIKYYIPIRMGDTRIEVLPNPFI